VNWACLSLNRGSLKIPKKKSFNGVIVHTPFFNVRSLLITITVPLNQVVLTEDARRFADQMGIRLFETSAKVGF